MADQKAGDQAGPAHERNIQTLSGDDAAIVLAPNARPALTWQDPLAFVASGTVLTVVHKGTTLAQSSDAIIVHEQGHRPVSYFPRQDVRLDVLAAIDHSTHCPRKGDASYFAVGGADGPVVAWSYEMPIPIAHILKNYIAFYSDKVELRKEV